jgi:hypothetical protein
MLGGLGHAPVLFRPTLLRYFSRLRFLPARVRSQHPFGVFGIYRTSSGRCVNFHQPLRDLIVTEHQYLMLIMIHYMYHYFNNYS